MKNYIIVLMGAVALLGFTGCGGDEPRHASTTTTTEETHVQQPAVQQTTSETQTSERVTN